MGGDWQKTYTWEQQGESVRAAVLARAPSHGTLIDIPIVLLLQEIRTVVCSMLLASCSYGRRAGHARAVVLPRGSCTGRRIRGDSPSPKNTVTIASRACLISSDIALIVITWMKLQGRNLLLHGELGTRTLGNVLLRDGESLIRMSALGPLK